MQLRSRRAITQLGINIAISAAARNAEIAVIFCRSIHNNEIAFATDNRCANGLRKIRKNYIELECLIRAIGNIVFFCRVISRGTKFPAFDRAI